MTCWVLTMWQSMRPEFYWVTTGCGFLEQDIKGKLTKQVHMQYCSTSAHHMVWWWERGEREMEWWEREGKGCFERGKGGRERVLREGEERKETEWWETEERERKGVVREGWIPPNFLVTLLYRGGGGGSNNGKSHRCVRWWPAAGN